MRRSSAPAGEVMDGDFNSLNPGQPLPAGYTVDAYMSGDLPTQADEQNIRPISIDDIVIAVMGPTGAGKSSFVNLATRQAHTAVGHGLESCTESVKAVSYPHPDGSGRNVVLVDTPGFNDTTLSDSDILASIARWFATTYTQEITLSGLLFFHRISDNRIAGNPLRNLMMFEKLCGAGALKNVILTTTMWDEIDEDIGSIREQELKAKYWRSMIACGSRIARFHHTYESAWEIIGQFSNVSNRLARPNRPVLTIQREMVIEKRLLHETSAGSALSQWFDSLIANIREKLRELEMRLRGSSEEDWPEDPTELEREKKEMTQKLERAKEQKEVLTSSALWRFLRDVAGRFRLTTLPGSRSSAPALNRRGSQKLKEKSLQIAKPDFARVTRRPNPSEKAIILSLTQTTAEPEYALETQQPPDPVQGIPQPSAAQVTPKADPTPNSPKSGSAEQAEPAGPVDPAKPPEPAKPGEPATPSPTPTHIKPKFHHHDERHGRLRALAGLVNGLKHAQALGSLSSIPFLPGAVKILLTVAQTIQGMEYVHHSLLTVTSNAGWLILAVTKQLEKGEVSDDIREMIVELIRSLEDVQNVVAKISMHGTATRYIFQEADEKVLAECHDNIRFACDRFQVQAVISIHHAILQLNTSHIAYDPPLGCSPPPYSHVSGAIPMDTQCQCF